MDDMFFAPGEEDTFARIKFLREMVTEQQLRHARCPLLLTQLQQLTVLLEKLHGEVDKLIASLKRT